MQNIPRILLYFPPHIVHLLKNHRQKSIVKILYKETLKDSNSPLW